MGLDSPLAGGGVSKSAPGAGTPAPGPQLTSALQRLESPSVPASVFPYIEHSDTVPNFHHDSAFPKLPRAACPPPSIPSPTPLPQLSSSLTEDHTAATIKSPLLAQDPSCARVYCKLPVFSNPLVLSHSHCL